MMMRKNIRERDILLTSIQDNKEWGEVILICIPRRHLFIKLG